MAARPAPAEKPLAPCPRSPRDKNIAAAQASLPRVRQTATTTIAGRRIAAAACAATIFRAESISPSSRDSCPPRRKSSSAASTTRWRTTRESSSSTEASIICKCSIAMRSTSETCPASAPLSPPSYHAHQIQFLSAPTQFFRRAQMYRTCSSGRLVALRPLAANFHRISQTRQQSSSRWRQSSTITIRNESADALPDPCNRARVHSCRNAENRVRASAPAVRKISQLQNFSIPSPPPYFAMYCN